jgi:hypothetical protein
VEQTARRQAPRAVCYLPTALRKSYLRQTRKTSPIVAARPGAGDQALHGATMGPPRVNNGDAMSPALIARNPATDLPSLRRHRCAGQGRPARSPSRPAAKRWYGSCVPAQLSRFRYRAAPTAWGCETTSSRLSETRQPLLVKEASSPNGHQPAPPCYQFEKTSFRLTVASGNKSIPSSVS